MITSIFAKSKPINYIIVSLIIVIGFVLPVLLKSDFTDFTFGIPLLSLFIVQLYVFVTDFIISKNGLSKRHNYDILVLGLMVAIFPEIFNDFNFVIANLLILFALRRLYSLHTKRNLKKKFFDAVFWIGLASLFYAWSILFLLVVIVALGSYWQNEGKYLAIAFLGLVAVFVLLVIYNVLMKDAYLLPSNFDTDFSLDFSSYNNPSGITRLTLVAAIYVWSLVFYFKTFGSKIKSLKPIHTLILLSSLVASIIVFVAPEKTGREFVFLFVPFSIIVANYIETIQEKWFREVFVALLIIIPFVKLVL